ncbi:proline-rich protein 36-like [Aphelocoma coerulescens]|uniref:proline-rich protein 36-like n=1 Tax=Aphelocoma coerulescens TaxID=39617 RepID=UPI00360526BA
MGVRPAPSPPPPPAPGPRAAPARTRPEPPRSPPEPARTSPNAPRSLSEPTRSNRTHPEPLRTHPKRPDPHEPLRTHPKPLRAHPNPSEPEPKPLRAHRSLSRAWPKRSRAHPKRAPVAAVAPVAPAVAPGWWRPPRPPPPPCAGGFLVPEIRPLDQYDGARARSAASLAWAIATGYGGAGNVPEELRDPFYTDQYAQEHLKPPVERLLLAADIYCRAWSHAQAAPSPAPPPPADLGALLALLAGRGLPPTLQGVPVRPRTCSSGPSAWAPTWP